MITQTASLLPVAFPRDATMQQATRNCATSHATGTQQPPPKPASLLDIARNKLCNMHATSAENTVQQAQQKTSEDVAQKITSWRWLLRFPDRDVEIYTIPESTLVQVLLDFPKAISAKPISDTMKRKATYPETRELTAAVNLIYANDTGTDQAEALAAALADPDDALACYRAMRDTLRTRTVALSLPGNVIAPSNTRERSQAHPSGGAA